MSDGNRVVIVHPERGVYLGEFLGLCFWSKWDAVGQTSVCTFADEADARDYVAGWGVSDPEACLFSYHTVVADVDGKAASAVALAAAGLGDHLGKLAHPGWFARMGHA